MTYDQLQGNYGYGGLGTPQDFYNQTNQQYGQLQQNVLGSIQGVGASQSQAIKDTYAQQSGAAQQSLAQRGLGNSTVVDATQRGLTLDEQKAQVALQNQLAQLQAGYMSQLGGAQLGFQTGFYGQQQGYAQQQQMQQMQAAQQMQLQRQQSPLANLQSINNIDQASWSRAAGGLGYAGAYGTRSF